MHFFLVSEKKRVHLYRPYNCLMMRRFFSLFLILLAAACSSRSTHVAKCLRISFNTSPTTFDPRKSGDFVSSTLIGLIYEGLTRCLPDGSAELALAYRVDLSENKKIYTFHLRKAFWSDGEPITAFDFEKSWKKIIDPSFPSICSYLLYPIKNGEKCAKGDLLLSEAGIKALDEATLQVELERPAPYFFSLTAFPLFLPIPSHIEEKDPDWEQKKNLVCSGPFTIEKFVPNSEISLKKNSKFWNPGLSGFDTIHISIVADENTALEMFEHGDLDWLGGPFSPLPPDALETIALRHSIHSIPSAASTFCTFNTEVFPFFNEKLRKAFSYAIDREQIAQQITNAGLPASRCLPPTLFTNRNQNHFFTDLELARSYFEKALDELHISPAELSNLTLYYKPQQLDGRLAQALQRQWKEVLGVSIQLQQLDFKTHLQRLQKRNYQISLASWIAQFNDPVNLLERFKDKKNLKNYPGWEDPRFASLLEEASLCLNQDERMTLLESAESLFAEQTPVAPLFHWNSPCIKSARIQEIATSPGGGVLLERFIPRENTETD